MPAPKDKVDIRHTRLLDLDIEIHYADNNNVTYISIRKDKDDLCLSQRSDPRKELSATSRTPASSTSLISLVEFQRRLQTLRLQRRRFLLLSGLENKINAASSWSSFANSSTIISSISSSAQSLPSDMSTFIHAEDSTTTDVIEDYQGVGIQNDHIVAAGENNGGRCAMLKWLRKRFRQMLKMMNLRKKFRRYLANRERLNVQDLPDYMKEQLKHLYAY